MKRANAVVGQRVIVKKGTNTAEALFGEVGTIVFDEGGHNKSLPILVEFDNNKDFLHDGHKKNFVLRSNKGYWLATKDLKKLK